MTATASRASMAVSKNLPSKDHEILLANTFSKEAYNRIKENLKQMQNNNNSSIQEIAKQLLKHQKYIPTHPIGI